MDVYEEAILVTKQAFEESMSKNDVINELYSNSSFEKYRFYDHGGCNYMKDNDNQRPTMKIFKVPRKNK